MHYLMFYGGSVDKEFACDAGDTSSIPGLGRYPGEGNGNSFPYSCLGNPMNRGVWRATVQGVTKESNMTERLNNKNRTVLEILLLLHPSPPTWQVGSP